MAVLSTPKPQFSHNHNPHNPSLWSEYAYRGTGRPQSNARYIHSHLRSFPNIRTLGTHHREAAILFPMPRFPCIRLLDDLDLQWPIVSERHSMRRYVIPPRYTREFQLLAHLLAKYISKLFYSPLISSIAAVTSSIAAAASSIAAKALSA